MNKIAATLPEYDSVMSMFGVGSVLGSQLIAEIGDVSRSQTKKALVGFCRIRCFSVSIRKLQSAISVYFKTRFSSLAKKTLFQVMSVVFATSTDE